LSHACLLASLILLLVVNNAAWAGNVGGTIERTLPKNEVEQKPAASAVQDEVDEFDIDNTNQTRVLIKTVSFKGNYLIDSETLQTSVAKYLNKDLSLKDFDRMRLDIIALYRARGFWANAIYEEQDITSYDVMLTIVEGRVGKISLNANDTLRFSAERAKLFISHNQTPGEPIQINVLDQSVANLDAIPGVNASLDLRQGEQEGETDIVVNTSPEPLFSGALVTDNYGSRSTGYGRATLSLNANSLFHLGEQLNLIFLKSDGDLPYYGLSASYPLLNDGTRVAYQYTNMEYGLGTPYASLNAYGDSKTQTLSLARPFAMPTGMQLSMKLDYSISDYLNIASNSVSSDNQIKNWLASLNLIFNDGLGGGYNNLTVSFEHGHTDLSGNASNYNADRTAAKTDGNYDKVSLNYTRIQTLLPTTQLWWIVSAQQALNRNLDSSKKISLGGAAAVRAYPSSEASGDIGIISQLELRHRLTSNFEGKLFYDFGYIQQYKHTYTNWNSDNTGMPNCYELQGVGLGFQWQALGNTTLVANVSTKVGTNAGESDGNDNDGTSNNTRGWIGMTVTF